MQTGHNTVLITGGTSGLGEAFAEAFYQAGSTVIICGRRAGRLEKMAQRFPGMQTRVCDIADAADRRALHAWVIKNYPGLNVFINNAGIQLLSDLTKEVDLDRVTSELETNLVAPVHLASLFAPDLAKQDEAALVNVSSGLAFCPIALMPIYCASKAAVHSFTLSLRRQLRHTSVKVFEIIPPSVDTELGHDRRADKNQSHGGIPIADFITGAMEAFRNDVLEAAVAGADGLRTKREALFDVINNGFESHL